MQEQFTIDRLQAMRGETVYASDGKKIGSVEEIFYDYETDVPEWIGIGTGVFSSKRVLVPIKGAEIRDDGITVPYAKEQVKDAPDIDGDEISQETERDLYAYYGLGYSERRSDTGLAEGSPADRRADREEVTRAEEELQVGKREVPAGGVRLRKWVETEPESVDVTLQRETARVTREQVDRPASGAEFGEEEVEVELREEQPVVAKQAVVKERVGVEKDVETERETVAEDVRKERVEVEGDAEHRE